MRLAGVLAVACTLVGAAAPAQPPVPDPKLVAIAQAALKAQQEGDLVQAEAGYRAFLAAEPRNVEVLANLGVVYAGLGRYDDAIVTYRKALAISHLNAPVRMNLGLAYYKAGRCAEALPEFAMVIESSPGAYAPTLLSADCQLQLGAFDQAIALLGPIASAHADDDAAASRWSWCRRASSTTRRPADSRRSPRPPAGRTSPSISWTPAAWWRRRRASRRRREAPPTRATSAPRLPTSPSTPKARCRSPRTAAVSPSGTRTTSARALAGSPASRAATT